MRVPGTARISYEAPLWHKDRDKGNKYPWLGLWVPWAVSLRYKRVGAAISPYLWYDLEHPWQLCCTTARSRYSPLSLSQHSGLPRLREQWREISIFLIGTIATINESPNGQLERKEPLGTFTTTTIINTTKPSTTTSNSTSVDVDDVRPTRMLI